MTRPGRSLPKRLVCEGCGCEFADRTTVSVMQMHVEFDHPEFEGTPRLMLLDAGQTVEDARARLDAAPEPNRAQRRRQRKGK